MIDRIGVHGRNTAGGAPGENAECCDGQAKDSLSDRSMDEELLERKVSSAIARELGEEFGDGGDSLQTLDGSGRAVR